MLAERQDLGITGLAVAGHHLDLGDAVGQAQRGLQRIGEAAFEAVALYQAVDDDLNGVVLIAGEFLAGVEKLGDVDDLAIDARPNETLSREVGEQRVVLALAAAHDRGKHLEPHAVGQLQHPIDDLLRRLT